MKPNHIKSALRAAAGLAAGLGLATLATAQTTIEIDVRSGGAPTVFVQAGQTVNYSVTAVLGGDPSQGLAMFAFDLVYAGGNLTQASAPASGALQQFVAPLGFNNPAGFGGTVRGGDLLQVGGAMNTINNQFAPVPSGTVVTGIGSGAAVELATGSLVAPQVPGSYALRIEDVFANALESQDPTGFWNVKAAELSAAAGLTVVVLDCTAATYCTGKLNSVGCVPSISTSGAASLGGATTLTLTANDVVNGQVGMFVYGTAPDARPLFGGTLCVGGMPTRLLEPVLSGGAGSPGSNCNGSYTRVIDSAFLVGAGFTMGDQVFCQWVFRDPAHPDGTGGGLTDAAAFEICP